MDALATLAAPLPPVGVVAPDRQQSVVVGATVGCGVVGTLLWQAHPILGMLGGFAVGSNAARVATKQIPVRRAVENLGAHVVATTGSLALPTYPALGYLSGVVASNIVLRRSDSLIDRFDETVIGESRSGETVKPSAALVPQPSRHAPDAPATEAREEPARTPWRSLLGSLLLIGAGVTFYRATRSAT